MHCLLADWGWERKLVLNVIDDSEGMTRLLWLLDRLDSCDDCKDDFDWLCKCELSGKQLERPWASNIVLISGKPITNTGEGIWRLWAWCGCCSGGAVIKGGGCSSTLESWWWPLLWCLKCFLFSGFSDVSVEGYKNDK